MQHGLSGIHHVTANAGEPRRNVDFYAGVLGLRPVKQTVNIDDPTTCHLYYGDGQGAPGSSCRPGWSGTGLGWSRRCHRSVSSPTAAR